MRSNYSIYKRTLLAKATEAQDNEFQSREQKEVKGCCTASVLKDSYLSQNGSVIICHDTCNLCLEGKLYTPPGHDTFCAKR